MSFPQVKRGEKLVGPVNYIWQLSMPGPDQEPGVNCRLCLGIEVNLPLTRVTTMFPDAAHMGLEIILPVDWKKG